MNWYVNREHPLASDANAGDEASPFFSVAKAAEVALTPGDHVFISPGIYPEPVVVYGAGTKDQPIIFEGVVGLTESAWPLIYTGLGGLQPLDQHNDDDIDGLNGQQNPYIVLDHLLLIGGVATFQARTGLGWVYRSCRFLGGTTALNVRSHGVTVQDCTFDQQDREAIVGFGASDLLVRNCRIERVNTRGAYDPAGSAVTKFGFTQRLLLEGNTVQDCVGPGLWLDYENTDAIVRGNTVRRARHLHPGREWEGSGIWVELNRGPVLVEDNHIEDCFIGIGVLESLKTTLRRNTITTAYRAVDLRMLDRHDPMWTVAGAVITGNTIESCQEGIVAGEGVWTGFDHTSLTITGNHYTAMHGPIIRWPGVDVTTPEDACQQLGFECATPDDPPVGGPYVYLVIGGTRVMATLDRARVIGLIALGWPEQSQQWRDAATVVLTETLVKGDAELSGIGEGWELSKGQSLTLHVTVLRS